MLRLKSTAVEINRWAIAQQVEKPSVDFNRFNRTSTDGSFFWRYRHQHDCLSALELLVQKKKDKRIKKEGENKNYPC